MVCQPPSTCARSTSTVRIELDDTVSPAEQQQIAAHWADLDRRPRRRARPTRSARASALRPAEGSRAGIDRARRPRCSPTRSPSEVTLTGITHLRGEALMLHAAGIATRRRPGHRVRRPVGPRQDHRVARARQRVRLRDRRDAGRHARRRRRALPQAPLPRRAPGAQAHRGRLGPGSQARSRRGAAPRGARAARPPARHRPALRRVSRADRRAGRARAADELPHRARQPAAHARRDRHVDGRRATRRVLRGRSASLRWSTRSSRRRATTRPRSPTSPRPSATATASTTCSRRSSSGPRSRASSALPAPTGARATSTRCWSTTSSW